MLKTLTYAALVSGLLLAPLGVSAKHPYPAERDFVDGAHISRAGSESPFPDQSGPTDYGIRISRADSESPFPDQSGPTDYGIHISRAGSESPFPDQSDSIDYGTRAVG